MVGSRNQEKQSCCSSGSNRPVCDEKYRECNKPANDISGTWVEVGMPGKVREIPRSAEREYRGKLEQ
jgi:hypothetical protein